MLAVLRLFLLCSLEVDRLYRRLEQSGKSISISQSRTFALLDRLPGRGKRIVIHNDSHSSRRPASCLAHELAHLLLVDAAEVVCTGDLASRADSLVEAEAAHLGGCILVPNEAACRIACSGLAPHTAAKSYGVSEEMITYQLSPSGALKRARRSA